MPEGRRGSRRFAQAWLPARTRGVSHRSASSIFWRLRSSGGPLAGGLPDRWGREPRPASPLPGDGLAWRGASRRSTARRHALRAALPEGRRRGGTVRAAARSVQHARSRVHGHDQPLFRGSGRTDPRTTRLFQGPSAGSQSDDPRGAARWRRPAGLHRDVARQHRRYGQPCPRRRQAAQALFHRPGLRRRGSRHDQRGNNRRTRGARASHILGVRERADKLVRELVLDDPLPSSRSPLQSGARISITRPRPSLSPDGATSSVAITNR